MDKESDLSNQRPEEIRNQIEETRSSLTEKLETLEHEVKETVRGATDAVVGTVQSVRSTVECTVEAVKGSVESTLESVRRTFDVQRRSRIIRGRWLEARSPLDILSEACRPAGGQAMSPADTPQRMPAAGPRRRNRIEALIDSKRPGRC